MRRRIDLWLPLFPAKIVSVSCIPILMPPVADEIAQMANSWRRDKGWLDHVAHEQVANPLCILPVSFVALLRFGVLGVCKCYKTGFFEDVEDRNPESAGRFHADFHAVILVKPKRQLLQALGEGREASLKVLSTGVCIGNADTGINPGFVNIQPAAVFMEDFEHGVPPARDSRVGRDWLSGEIESTLEEISLRATVLRHSLMP